MSQIPVIVTRAQPGARQSARRIEDLGHSPLISPALTLQADPGIDLKSMTHYSGLVFTSANGVRFFVERNKDRRLPAWCVGPATARAAREAGFIRVHESAGNSRDLAAFIASTIGPPKKPLLHIANAAARGVLTREMKMRRYPFQFVPLYRADVAPRLSTEVSKLLKAKTPAIVLIHSAKGAEAFAQLAAKLPTTALTGVAISTAATTPLRSLDITQFHVAETPNERDLMRALTTAIATLST